MNIYAFDKASGNISERIGDPQNRFFEYFEKIRRKYHRRVKTSEKCFFERRKQTMPENYARETNVKSCCGKDCRNSKGGSDKANEKSSSNAMNCREPMSKQSAAQRKTEDCGR